MSNPFGHASLLSLETLIEKIDIDLWKRILTAETGEDWATIAEIEARQLSPLLLLQRRSA